MGNGIAHVRTDQNVANAVYLGSEEAAGTTGHTLDVNGGMYIN